MSIPAAREAVFRRGERASPPKRSAITADADAGRRGQYPGDCHTDVENY